MRFLGAPAAIALVRIADSNLFFLTNLRDNALVHAEAWRAMAKLLVAMMSREIRTLMKAVLGLATTLPETNLNREQLRSAPRHSQCRRQPASTVACGVGLVRRDANALERSAPRISWTCSTASRQRRCPRAPVGTGNPSGPATGIRSADIRIPLQWVDAVLLRLKIFTID